jgi:uncharacterized membrane-anchored protein YitT (DUF2179 family)
MNRRQHSLYPYEEVGRMQQWTSRLPFRVIFMIMLGTAIYAFSLQYFVIPNELMEGGVTGIALLLRYAFHIPPSITTLVLNIPLFFVGLKAFGRGSMMYTLFGVLSLSFFLWLMEIIIGAGWIVPFVSQQDYFLVTLYAGLTLGTGLGIVFRFGGTTGGVDIIARIVQKRRGTSVGQIILLFDAFVIGASLFYIPIEKVLYTLVAVFISSRMIDFITEGVYAAKAFTIITDNGDALSAKITKEIDRGVTIFPAKGAYSRLEKEVIYCVVYRHEVRRLKMLVKSEDPSAFIIISNVHDVLGEGFKEA